MSEIVIVRSPHFTDKFINDWSLLFSSCFQRSESSARKIFEKYLLNDSILACLYSDGQLVACYGGLSLSCPQLGKIFLSTDTMSNGVLGGATKKLATNLYQILESEGHSVVCGFPNSNILKLRQRLLSWKISGGIDLYLGIPLLWRLFRNKPSFRLWKICKPCSNSFSDNFSFFTLLGGNSLYGFLDSLKPAMFFSSKSPGMFFFKVPRLIGAYKPFGYRILSNDIAPEFLESLLPLLNGDCIDVP